MLQGHSASCTLASDCEERFERTPATKCVSGIRVCSERVKLDKIPVVRSGMGMSIISTSKGIMSGKQASDQKIGGELLATIW